MKYQIAINGMHCQGCGTLIQLTLEDEVFKDVSVDLSKLKKAFADLDGYTYLELKEVPE